MPDAPPLSTLLSWLLVAYTIELDNEFEHGMRQLSARRAFRVSLVMWDNLLRLVGEGVRVGDIPARAGLPVKLHAYLAMERWGYVVVSPAPDDTRAKPPRRDWLVRPTAVGAKAVAVWGPLQRTIEQRWRERFGSQQIDELRRSLGDVVARIGVDRPRYLPVVTYGWAVEPAPPEHRRASGGFSPDTLGLSALLSLVLLELTLDFERQSSVSLALSANVLRLARRDVQPLNVLRQRAGISREAVAVAAAYLARHGLGVVESAPAPSRARTLHLTPKGEQVAAQYPRLCAAVESAWHERFGATAVAALRESLLAVVTQREGERWRLADGLAPHPDCWRAARPYLAQTTAMLADPTSGLPHHPLVTHRGGWPDGS